MSATTTMTRAEEADEDLATCRHLIHIAAEIWQVSPVDIVGPGKCWDLTDVRCAIWLVASEMQVPGWKIRRSMGRGHDSRQTRRAKNRLETDKRFASLYRRLRGVIC
jgi:hypothetical protein